MGGFLEVMGFSLAFSEGWRNFFLCYNSCASVSSDELRHFFSQMPIWQSCKNSRHIYELHFVSQILNQYQGRHFTVSLGGGKGLDYMIWATLRAKRVVLPEKILEIGLHFAAV